MIDLASSLKLLAYVSLIVCLFLPFGLARGGVAVPAYAFGASAWAVKLAVAGTMLGVLEMSTAKMRVFRVPNFLGAALMLGFLGVLLLFVSRGM
jgi:formate hydrogenlyase subunit 4